MAQTVEEILQEAFDMYSGREVNEAAEKEFITKFKAARRLPAKKYMTNEKLLKNLFIGLCFHTPNYSCEAVISASVSKSGKVVRIPAPINWINTNAQKFPPIIDEWHKQETELLKKLEMQAIPFGFISQKMIMLF